MTPDVPISWPRIEWLLKRGVPRDVIARCVNLRTVGDAIAFYEEIDDDVVLWSPRSGELVADRGRAFALGGSDLNASSGALQPLRIFAGPLDWLKSGGNGLVVVDWRQAFDRLRDVPQVAVAEAVLFQYRRAMQPTTPKVAVITAARELAA